MKKIGTNKGITLVELLLYIGLLSMLLSTIFSIAFTLQSGATEKQAMIDGDYYLLSAFEASKNIASFADDITMPTLGTTSDALQTSHGSLWSSKGDGTSTKLEDGNVKTFVDEHGHEYRFLPPDFNFLRNQSDTVSILIGTPGHNGTSRHIVIDITTN